MDLSAGGNRVRLIVTWNHANRKVDRTELLLAGAQHRIIYTAFEVVAPATHDRDELQPIPLHDLRTARRINRDEILEVIDSANLCHAATLRRLDVLRVIEVGEPFHRKGTPGDPHHEQGLDRVAM